jgi:hypothetical protein
MVKTTNQLVLTQRYPNFPRYRQVAGPEVALPPAALPDSNLVFPKPLPWLPPQVRRLSLDNPQ